MPTPFPVEFRADVIAVARKGEAAAAPDREGLRHLGSLPAWLNRDRATTLVGGYDEQGQPLMG